MPFSYSYFSSSAILLMIACVGLIELVRYLRRHPRHQ